MQRVGRVRTGLVRWFLMIGLVLGLGVFQNVFHPHMLGTNQAEQNEAQTWISHVASVGMEVIPDVEFYTLYSKGDQLLFAGSNDGYVYRSEDGVTFERLNLKASQATSVKSIYVDSRGYIYASGTHKDTEVGYIFRSLDDGDTWESVVRSQEWGRTNGAIWRWAELSNGTLLAGFYNDKSVPMAWVYASEDGGETWFVLLNYTAREGLSEHVHNVFADSDDRIYVSIGDEGRALLVSDDLGQTWTKVFDNDGFTGIDELGDYIVLAPDNSTTSYSLMKKGSNLVIPTLKPDITYDTSSIAYDLVQHEGVLISATHNSDEDESSYVFFSADGGWTWLPLMHRPGWGKYTDLHVYRGYAYMVYRAYEDQLTRVVVRFPVPTPEQAMQFATRQANLAPNAGLELLNDGLPIHWRITGGDDGNGGEIVLRQDDVYEGEVAIHLKNFNHDVTGYRTIDPIPVRNERIVVSIFAKPVNDSINQVRVDIRSLDAQGERLIHRKVRMPLNGSDWQRVTAIDLVPPGTVSFVPIIYLATPGEILIDAIEIYDGDLPPWLLDQNAPCCMEPIR